MVGQITQLTEGDAGEERGSEVILRCSIPTKQARCIHGARCGGAINKVIVAHHEITREATDATAIVTHEIECERFEGTHDGAEL